MAQTADTGALLAVVCTPSWRFAIGRALEELDRWAAGGFNRTMPDHGSSSASVAPAFLVQRSGGGGQAGERHALAEGEHVLGRGTGISVQIDSSDVSRHHARLSIDAGGADIFDLHSKNGVWVEGRRIDGSARLEHGDRFTIGDVEFELEHACSRAAKILERSGEATTTTSRPTGPRVLGEGSQFDVTYSGSPLAASGSSWLVMAGVVVFAGLALASWWLPW